MIIHCNADPTSVCLLFISVVCTKLFTLHNVPIKFLMFRIRHVFDLNEHTQSLTLSHTQWCIDVFVNPVITSVIYKFYPITKTSQYNDNQQPLSHCQHGYYSHIYTTSVHTSVFIVSLPKWSFNFKIIPGVPPRIDLILLVLICRVTPNDYKVVGTDT